MAENNRWFLLKVRSTFESLVDRELTKRRFETFLPERQDFRDARPSNSLLFPGHVFCRFDLADANRVLSAPGVLCALGLPNAFPFDDGDISGLRTAVSSNLPYVLMERCDGQAVRMFTGPLRGVVGAIFERNGRQKFGLNVKVLERMLVFDVGDWSFRPLHRESRPLAHAAHAHVRPNRSKGQR